MPRIIAGETSPDCAFAHKEHEFLPVSPVERQDSGPISFRKPSGKKSIKKSAVPKGVQGVDKPGSQHPIIVQDPGRPLGRNAASHGKALPTPPDRDDPAQNAVRIQQPGVGRGIVIPAGPYLASVGTDDAMNDQPRTPGLRKDNDVPSFDSAVVIRTKEYFISFLKQRTHAAAPIEDRTRIAAMHVK